jgi:hypothetical protein
LLSRSECRRPTSGGSLTLIQTLRTGNSQFTELWSAAGVSAHREGHTIVEHPTVGPIEVDCDVLTDGDAELKIVILSAASNTEDETKLRLALVTGTHDLARAEVAPG